MGAQWGHAEAPAAEDEPWQRQTHLACPQKLQPDPRAPVLPEICVSVVEPQQTALHKYSWVTRPTANRTEVNLIKSTQHALCSNIQPLAAAPPPASSLLPSLPVCSLSDSVSPSCLLADGETHKHTPEPPKRYLVAAFSSVLPRNLYFLTRRMG